MKEQFYGKNGDWVSDVLNAEIFEDEDAAKSVACEANGLDWEESSGGDGYYEVAFVYIPGAEGFIVLGPDVGNE